MSEPTPPYAGHTALCAAFEQGAGLAAEVAGWRAILTARDRADLREFAAHGVGMAISFRALSYAARSNDRLLEFGLVAYVDEDAAYYLTPFGATVARALGEG